MTDGDEEAGERWSFQTAVVGYFDALAAPEK
jgi:hypothetical protein